MKSKPPVVTHLWGKPADMAGLTSLAKDRDLDLLEDGSHAHGAIHGRQKVGTFGLAGAFSLNGPKPLSGGEGGFVLTDDDTYYRILTFAHYNKRARNEIPEDHPLTPYAVTGAGLKLRIHPLAAALAHDQLARLDAYLAGREEIAAYLTRELGQIPGLEVTPMPEGVKSSSPAIRTPQPLPGGRLPHRREGAQAHDQAARLAP